MLENEAKNTVKGFYGRRSSVMVWQDYRGELRHPKASPRDLPKVGKDSRSNLRPEEV